MKTGDAVIVKRIAAAKFPMEEPGSWDEWRYGEARQEPLALYSEVRGFLLAPVEPGGRIALFRTATDGIGAEGIFVSEPVISVRGRTVETINSTYEVRPW